MKINYVIRFLYVGSCSLCLVVLNPFYNSFNSGFSFFLGEFTGAYIFLSIGAYVMQKISTKLKAKSDIETKETNN